MFRREAAEAGKCFEVGELLGGERQTDEPWRVAEVGDVDETFVVGAAHVQRPVVTGRALEPELGEERLHDIEVWRLEANEGDVGDAHGHDPELMLSPGEV